MTTETITQIALDDLHESPFNPRKTFSSVDELALQARAAKLRPIELEDAQLDAADPYTRLFLLAEYWQRRAKAGMAAKNEAESRELKAAQELDEAIYLLHDFADLCAEFCDHTPDSFNRQVMLLGNVARLLLNARKSGSSDLGPNARANARP